MTHDVHPERRSLPPAAADRLLTRAAELDASLSDHVTVATLRAAATEAGISAQGFDAALAEVQRAEARPARGTPPALAKRGSRWRLLAAGGLAVLLATGTWAVPRTPAPASTPASRAAGTVEEAFLLRCLAPGDAADLLRPLVADRSTAISFAPARAPHVLTVRATPARLAEVRAWLAQHDRAGASVCAAGTAGSAAPSTP